MKWTNLAYSGLPINPDHPGSDAQLIWAGATNFVDLERRVVDGGVGEMPNWVPLLMELSQDSSVTSLMEAVGTGAIHVPPSYQELPQYSHCAALVHRHALACLIDPASPAAKLVQRFELQTPVLPQRPKLQSGGNAPHSQTKEASEKERGRSTSEVLLGVIDSACPFAHPHLRQAHGTGTRVLNWWVQDGAALTGKEPMGQPVRDFGYGYEASRKSLNALMTKCSNGNMVDEAACYERAGAHNMRHRFTHGSAVLDLLASPLPLTSRMNAGDDQSPTWKPCTEHAATADIAVVQIPQDAIQDSSSASINRFILDGLHYILSCARTGQRVVVNISEGSSRGSHDGESIFERALVELLNKHPNLHIVLAAGNSFDEDRHAQFDSLKKGTPRSVTFRLPPDCESPAFAFIRLPQGNNAFTVRVRPPGHGELSPDQSVSVGQAKGWALAEKSDSVACSVIYPRPLPDLQAAVAMVAWAPTQSLDGTTATAPCGDWAIEVESLGDATAASPVHLYIARNQTNPGALPRARQARFIEDEKYEDKRRHLEMLEDDETPCTSTIRRRGSLNSLATFEHPRLTVVGSYLYKEKTRSAYSSEGPAACSAPNQTPRQKPDAWAPTDTHRALKGVRACTGVGGTVLRVVGTSFAAPQVARVIANTGSRPSPVDTGRRTPRIK
jgi:hypothetical protein